MTTMLPTFFVSHGGGPWPWMHGAMRDAHDRLAIALGDMPGKVGVRPKAVLVISAHWEEPEFTVMASAKPPMIYDFTGFPEQTYQVRYSAPGSPQLAEQVRHLLQDAGITVRLDAAQGFDHGTYVPLSLIYPAADIPVIQLSLKSNLDPRDHLAAGHALASLCDEGVLIIGSGSSWHNVRTMGRPEARAPAAAFDGWLQHTLVQAKPDERASALAAWIEAPAALQAHPREEHLLPLMVAASAAKDGKGTCVYHEDVFFGTGDLSNFMFGGSGNHPT